MSSPKPNVLRKIAEQELGACFGDLPSTTRNELATSLMRQWHTNDGAAVLITSEHHFWFRVTPREDGTRQVVREVQEGTFSAHLRRSRVLEDQIPTLLHELNLRQSARCYTDQGELLQLRVDPAKRLFHIELVPDQER